MLILEDPSWSTLTHAYGSAQDIPVFLRQLAKDTKPKTDYKADPWFSLWSALCHQGDAYDASYAALPHIVEIALSAKGPIDNGFYLLPAAIEIARDSGQGPVVPPQLAPAYQSGIAALSKCVADHIDDAWDKDALTSAMTALAVSKGQIRIAQALMNLEEEFITKLIEMDF